MGEGRGETPRPFGAVYATEAGKDAFHRVPFIPGEVLDSVERVLTGFKGNGSSERISRVGRSSGGQGIPEAGEAEAGEVDFVQGQAPTHEEDPISNSHYGLDGDAG